MVAPSKKVSELAGRRRQPQGKRTMSVTVPAPQGGINALAGVANQTFNDALYMDNMIPSEYGNAVRKGFKEWCPPIPAGDGIKTIIPFSNRQDLVDNDRLFACTSDGIYEITQTGVAPVKKLDWPVKSTRAGWCSWTNYTTLGGYYILLCDLENGYYVYNGTTNVWAQGNISTKPPNATPIDKTLDFVMVWKNRVWLIQQDSGTAYYLDPGEFQGAKATPFNFGNKFRYGGYLKGLYNWTLDGGNGIDDYLVGISDAGDLVIYQGTDPGTAGGFVMRGVYYVGKVPRGRRITTEYGGDLLVLSTFGALLASKLVAGLPLGDEALSITSKVNSRLNDIMQRTLNQFGWEVKIYPAEHMLMVVIPKEAGVPPQQYVYNMLTQSWCRFLGIPVKTAETWRGKFFLGSDDNRIFTYEGYADNVLLGDNGESSYAIDWQLLHTFNTFGSPNFKRVQMLRPQFVAGVAPAYFVEARYDFDLERISSAPPYVDRGTSTWDTGVWDTAQWGGGFTRTVPTIGSLGMGRHIAVALRGRSSSDVIYVTTDVMLDAGGML